MRVLYRFRRVSHPGECGLWTMCLWLEKFYLRFIVPETREREGFFPEIFRSCKFIQIQISVRSVVLVERTCERYKPK